MIRRSGIATIALMAVSGLVAASPPSPTKSKYLVTTGAGFMLEEGKGARYVMTYALRSFPLPDLYVVSVFDNPEDPSAPLRAEEKVEGGLADFPLNSPFFHAATNDRIYTVELSIYTDEAHTKLAATHKQKVLFRLDPARSGEIKRRYGVDY